MRFTPSLVLCAALALSFATRAVATPLPSDGNLLSGLAGTPGNISTNINVSSTFAPSYSADNATDGAAGGSDLDFVFAPGDSNQRLGITGFNSSIGTIRIWSTDLRPLEVTILSSTTSKTSLAAGDYETSLVPLTLLTTSTWNPNGGPSQNPTYLEFTVSAPVGTKSLYFAFGNGNDTQGANNGFARIGELQAFAPVPEPASLVLGGLGAVGLLIAARRRKA